MIAEGFGPPLKADKPRTFVIDWSDGETITMYRLHGTHFTEFMTAEVDLQTNPIISLNVGTHNGSTGTWEVEALPKGTD